MGNLPVSLDRSLTASLWVDGAMVASGPSAIDQPLSAAVEQLLAELRAATRYSSPSSALQRQATAPCDETTNRRSPRL